MTALAKIRSKRRFLRYSLRALLLLVLVAALPMAWLAKVQREYEAELQALDRLSDFGIVQLHEEREDSLMCITGVNGMVTTSAAYPAILHTLARWLGDPGLDRATSANLNWWTSGSLDDEIVPHLAHLKYLKSVDVRGTSITEEGIHELRRALPDCEIAWDPNYSLLVNSE